MVSPSPANLPPSPEPGPSLLRRCGQAVGDLAKRAWAAANAPVPPRSSDWLMTHLPASGSETGLPALLADADQRRYYEL
jgi:hypothetical protein